MNARGGNCTRKVCFSSVEFTVFLVMIGENNSANSPIANITLQSVFGEKIKFQNYKIDIETNYDSRILEFYVKLFQNS